MTNLVVALPSEARPLIKFYDLEVRPGARGFPVYAKDDLRLVVTGVGKIQAAAGTAYLAGFEQNQGRSWLNVGIAGHCSLPTGTVTFAHKITDYATNRSWYPPKIIDMPGAGAHITTYDHPVADYPTSVVCEMEAAAFYSVATRFSSGELVQCCKIISDNTLFHANGLTPDLIEDLISAHIQSVDSVVQALRSLIDGSATYGDTQEGTHG